MSFGPTLCRPNVFRPNITSAKCLWVKHLVGKMSLGQTLCLPNLIGPTLGQPNVFWTSISLAKCLLDENFIGQISFSQTMCQPNIFQLDNVSAKCLLTKQCVSQFKHFTGQNVFWTSISLAKCLLDKHFTGQNVFWPSISLAKCLSNKYCISQMSFRQTLCQPNVVGWSLGACNNAARHNDKSHNDAFL